LAFTRTVTHNHLTGTWASISETRSLLNAKVNGVAQKIGNTVEVQGLLQCLPSGLHAMLYVCWASPHGMVFFYTSRFFFCRMISLVQIRLCKLPQFFHTWHCMVLHLLASTRLYLISQLVRNPPSRLLY